MKALALLLALAGAQVFATEKPVSQMTCGEAIAYVGQHKRFYVETKADGIIPIYPIIPLSVTPVCKMKEIVQYILVPTLDNADCHVGYNCRPN